MISKAQVKLVRSLQQKKFRDQLGYFVAEGDKCINELKKSFECVLLVDSTNATPTEIAQMSAMRTPQGSIAVFKQSPAFPVHPPYRGGRGVSPIHQLILALDGVQDPGNLGTIIRTADWFGVRDIVCSSDTADCYNPKVVQATMGALARVRVHYTDLAQWLSEQTVPVYGTLLDGKNIYEILSDAQPCTPQSQPCIVHREPCTPQSQPCIVHREPCIVVMGNEGNGISQEVRKVVTTPIRIPSYPENADTSESLNVAIATAIILAEFRRPHPATCPI